MQTNKSWPKVILLKIYIILRGSLQGSRVQAWVAKLDEMIKPDGDDNFLKYRYYYVDLIEKLLWSSLNLLDVVYYKISPSRV